MKYRSDVDYRTAFAWVMNICSYCLRYTTPNPNDLSNQIIARSKYRELIKALTIVIVVGFGESKRSFCVDYQVEF